MAAPTQLNDIQQRSDLSLSLYDLHKNKECCDVTVCITDPQSCDQIYSIECHKVVLVAASQYFRDILLVGEDSSNLNMVHIGKCRIAIIEEIISFLYTGKCKVSSANIVELLRYSLDLKLKNLERLITELVVNYLTVENVVKIYELAAKEGKEGLEKESSMFLRKNFDDVTITEQFKALSITSLCTILKEDEIKVDSEDSIMRAVLMWLECNPQATSGVNDFWSVIRFEHLTARYLMKELLDHPLMQAEPQRDLVKEAVVNLYENGQGFARGIVPRYWGVKPVYDKLAKVTVAKKICVYDDESKVWEEVGDVPQWVDKGTHCCVTGSTVVLLGALEKNKAQKCVTVDLKGMLISTQLPDCSKGINRRGVAQIDNTIYSIGGSSSDEYKNKTDEVDFLNVHQSRNKWEAVESLPIAVDSPLIFTYKQSVFAIGGVDSEGNQSNMNHVYDKNHRNWAQRKSAPQCCYSYQHGGFINNNQIHIFRSTYHMTYTINTDMWTCIAYDEVGFHVQPVLHGDRILACVKSSRIVDQENNFKCMSYDKVDNQWKEVDIDVQDCLMHRLFFTFKK